jgi:benzil reductase ((S)-benzoin forming)
MRLALITGGSRGLGLALCEQLNAQGFRVIEFSRSAPHAWSVQTDLSSPEEIGRAVATAVDEIGDTPLRELLVIGNAGIVDPIGPASHKQQNAVICNLNTNFTSGILFITAVIALFQTHNCRKVIANISSGAAQHGYAGWSLYCASKAGLENFIHALALEQQAEMHPFVAININPGVIDTEMQAVIRAASAQDFPEVNKFIQRKEQGVLVPPEKVAAATLRILALSSLAYGASYSTSDYPG